MGRILLVGDQGGSSSASSGSGACIARTERFRKALCEAGFHVTVCSPEEGKAGARHVRKFVGDNSPDCVVAISPFPAECAVTSGIDLPLWIDMNGMHPAELQMQNREDSRYSERMIRILALENSLLLRGDGFSTPSVRQAAALTGELLLLGRTDFSQHSGLTVIPVPHSAASFKKSRLRQPDPDVFNLISTGSFNVWFDEQVLFFALEEAMSKCDGLTFTATGGPIPFSPGKFSKFSELVENSSFRDRFSLPGWVPGEELEQIYQSADAATYTDVPSPETFLGARTRVLDWISRGIPVVCTSGAEVSQDIQKHGLGTVVRSGDSNSLAAAFLELAANSGKRAEISRNQEKWCGGAGSSTQVYRDFIRWCREPVRVKGRALGKPTVSRLNSPGYLSTLFFQLAKSAGTPYALKRVFRKLFPL